jgi:hypothetical protein
MRAAEFMRALADIIDQLDGNESSDSQPKNPEEKDPNPIMVSPLQQELELDKAEAGSLKTRPSTIPTIQSSEPDKYSN